MVDVVVGSEFDVLEERGENLEGCCVGSQTRFWREYRRVGGLILRASIGKLLKSGDAVGESLVLFCPSIGNANAFWLSWQILRASRAGVWYLIIFYLLGSALVLPSPPLLRRHYIFRISHHLSSCDSLSRFHYLGFYHDPVTTHGSLPAGHAHTAPDLDNLCNRILLLAFSPSF